MSEEPQRLFESSDAPAELRMDLQRAREDDPARYDVVAGLAAFEASIAGAAVGGEEAVVAGGSKSVTWIVAAVIGVVSAGAIVWAVGRDSDRDEVAAHAVPVPVSAPEPEPEPEPEPVAKAEPAPTVPEAIDEPPPAKDRVRPKIRRTAPAEPTPDLLAAEMKATKAAEQVLRSDPSRALTLARQADRDFPKGLFQQERRAIVVLALFELGRVDEAKQKARAYLARHPKGSFADKIREQLEKHEG